MASSSASHPTIAQISRQLAERKPFNLVDHSDLSDWLSSGKLIKVEPGQTLIARNQLQDRVYLLISGSVRLLFEDEGNIHTLAKRGSGQFIGWTSFLRAEPCEWVCASEECLVLALPSSGFIKSIQKYPEFESWFSRLPNIQENLAVANSLAEIMPQKFSQWKDKILEKIENCFVVSFIPGETFVPPDLDNGDTITWHLSTSGVPDFPVGSLIRPGQDLPEVKGFTLRYRVIGFPSLDDVGTINGSNSVNTDSVDYLESLNSVSLASLGIVEADLQTEEDIYPIIRGKGDLNETLAVCEMLALYSKVPFRRDTLKKILEGQFRRDKALSVQLLGGLCEILGFISQVGTVDSANVGSVEAPVLFFYQGSPAIIFEINPDLATIGSPSKGLLKISTSELKTKIENPFKFALPRKVSTTPTSRFGWSWFTPLLNKYRKSLVLVFVASLLAQLFGLAIPLLIQQIIDKVLSQGNLSSLNLIGGLMIVLAIFQGCLLALRQYIFVDTTDRMDLSLGSAVIDRLLSLPLSFFEKRPVGELSQRLGELNTIRGFLTGTALVSILNIIFAALYLVVMLMYSPVLTAIALSTFPLYAALVFGISPLYRYLIRQRANAQAKTQSHLIEVLGGIQTVKAQHFELTSRWKWQDRYKGFVSEGFKAAVLGTTSGTVGSILNTISSLLVLWYGMYLVLEGELTLGMLIAFRIIAGNVTGPLMQLSGLYQGFQKMQVSMERLSDILDQNPELSNSDDVAQIALPSVKGNIRYENVRFRFGDKGPYQVNRVSLEGSVGQLVGHWTKW